MTFVKVHTTLDAVTIVAAIMVGSLSWWILLSNVVARFRYLVDSETIKKVNTGAGYVFIAFGFVLLTEIFLNLRGHF